MRIVIVGGSAAGLSTALLLARRGHRVVVLDRHRLEPAPDVETAAESSLRATAPQIVHPHALLARGRELLTRSLPDVFEALLAAGAVEAPLQAQMPLTLTDRRPHDGDEQLTMLMTRRSTFDWVLQRAASEQTHICLKGGVKVTGLLSRPTSPPDVYGVSTTSGEFRADAVIDASGRRSAIDQWLAQINARPAQKWAAECGLAYFSRHYRRRDVPLPGPDAIRLVAALDEVTAGVWSADNGTMLFAIAPLTNDRRFLRTTDPAVFDAVLRTFPPFAARLDGLEPISRVFAMSGLHNTMRRQVTDGEPIVTGLHAVGDSVCTTNPTLGRGLTLALQTAVDVADVLDSGTDPASAAVELDRRIQQTVQPFYEDQVKNDATRLAGLRHAVFGHPAADEVTAPPGSIDFAQLRATAPADPVVFRAFLRLLGMLQLPESVYRDPIIVRRVRELLDHRESLPVMAQPTRADLVRALS